MRFLDLFSGIGGFSLGLERAGHQTVAFCEIDPYCRKVLARHWPNVPCYDDIRTLTAARLAADGIIAPTMADTGNNRRMEQNIGAMGNITQTSCKKWSEQAARAGYSGIDAICGGFPCQDISVAGKGAGIEGERSGLWSEYRRLIGELRPRYVIVENVAALLNRGLERVLGDLASLRYDAEWHCIPASAVGAPHRRDRVWIVAYSEELRRDRRSVITDPKQGQEANKHVSRRAGAGGDVADASEPRLQVTKRKIIFGERRGREWRAIAECSWWLTEPNVGRVAHGVPARVDRLRALGNAVVPQIPEIIGLALND